MNPQLYIKILRVRSVQHIYGYIGTKQDLQRIATTLAEIEDKGRENSVQFFSKQIAARHHEQNCFILYENRHYRGQILRETKAGVYDVSILDKGVLGRGHTIRFFLKEIYLKKVLTVWPRRFIRIFPYWNFEQCVRGNFVVKEINLLIKLLIKLHTRSPLHIELHVICSITGRNFGKEISLWNDAATL